MEERAGVEPAQSLGTAGLQPAYFASKCLSIFGADGQQQRQRLLFAGQMFCQLNYVSEECRGQVHVRTAGSLDPATSKSAGSAPTFHTIHVVKESKPGQQKSPDRQYQPGLFRAHWKVRCIEPSSVCLKGLEHQFLAIEVKQIRIHKYHSHRPAIGRRMQASELTRA